MTLNRFHDNEYHLSILVAASAVVLYVDPLEFRDNSSATSNNMQLVHWPLMGRLLHLVQQGWVWAGPQVVQAPLAVPNVTAHPSTASVVTVLLYNSPLLCSFNVPIKGLTVMKLKHFSLTVSITIRLQARLLQRSRAMLCVTEYFAKSLIVIRNDKDVCKSLLVFHCNYVSISYCF